MDAPPTEGNEKITKKLIQIFEKESDSAKKPAKEEAAAADLSHQQQAGPSSRSSSPEPNCAICLEQLQNKSFTDSCFHTFCFTCLVEWSKVKPECPLCKQKFKSIVHNVQKDLTFEEYHIASRSAAEREPLVEMVERFRYRTTRTRISTVRNVMADVIMSHRMQFAPHTVVSLPPSVFSSSSGGNTRGTLEFRRRVYSEGLWVKRPSLHQVRAASPDFYRRNPACTHRLLPWLQREMEALLGPFRRGDSRRLMNAILTELPRTDLNSPEFADMVRPHLGPQTTHFLYEFLNFAASPVSMEVYDQTAEYSFLPSTHPAQPLIIPPIRPLYPDSAEGRAAVPLDMSFRPPRARRVSPAWVPAGPSSLPPPRLNVTSEEDDDEVQVVEVVKPRHERTPELVQLSSSDDDEAGAVIDISSDSSASSPYIRHGYPPYSSFPYYSDRPQCSNCSPVFSSSLTYEPPSPSSPPYDPPSFGGWDTPPWPSSPTDSDVECVFQGKLEVPCSPPPIAARPSTSRAGTSEPQREERRQRLASAIVVPRKRSKSHRFSDSSSDDSGARRPKKPAHREDSSHDSSSRHSSYKLTVAFKKHKKKKHKEKKKHSHKHKRRPLSDSESD